MMKHDSRVLVADAKRALLLRNGGTPIKPVLEVEQRFDAPQNGPTRDQGTDRPGRTGGDSRRSSHEQTDFHQQAEDQFLTWLAEQLDGICSDGGISGLLVIAPPRALATLRQHLSAGTRALVTGEIDKDLVHLPIHEIAAHLTPVT